MKTYINNDIYKCKFICYFYNSNINPLFFKNPDEINGIHCRRRFGSEWEVFEKLNG